jgi:hypothetical protein
MTIYLREDTALKIANAHEKGMPTDNSHKGLDSRRDKHNNQRGILIDKCAKINLRLGNISK